MVNTTNTKGGGGGSVVNGVSPSWVDGNYLSKEYFNQLLSASGEETVYTSDDDGQTWTLVREMAITMLPNETPSEVIEDNETLGILTKTVRSLTGINAIVPASLTTLTVGSTLKIGGNLCYIESMTNGESINIRAEQKIEMTDADLFMNDGSIHISGSAAVAGYIGLYFNDTHYMYCSGNDLYFYDGTTHKKVAFI
jgi:hypothetical protein